MKNNVCPAPPSWLLQRMPEVKFIKKGNRVTVEVPEDVSKYELGALLTEALRLASLQ